MVSGAFFALFHVSWTFLPLCIFLHQHALCLFTLWRMPNRNQETLPRTLMFVRLRTFLRTISNLNLIMGELCSPLTFHFAALEVGGCSAVGVKVGVGGGVGGVSSALFTIPPCIFQPTLPHAACLLSWRLKSRLLCLGICFFRSAYLCLVAGEG